MQSKVDLNNIIEQTKLTGEDFLQLLLDSLPIEVFVKSIDGKYIYVNERQSKDDKVSKSEYLGKKDSELFGEATYPLYSETDKKVLENGKPITFISDAVSTKYLKTNKFLLKEEDGNLIGIAGYSYDVADTVNQIKELNNEVNRFRGVFDNSPLGIAIYDSNIEHPNLMNDVYTEITGRSREEMLELPWEAYSHPDEIEENRQYLKLMLDGKINGFNMEKRYIKPDGSVTWVDMTVSKYKDEISSDAHLVMVADITDKKEAETKVKYYSDHDAMTGLYNRKFGDDMLIVLDKPENLPLSIIVADANGLKVTNDAFGHMEGDRLIKKLANIFLEVVGSAGYVVRTGGDEFMVILPNTLGTEALDLRKKIEQKFEEDSQECFLLSMAIGCATKTYEEETVEQVYQTAEVRMYHTKLQDSDVHKTKIIEHLQKKLEDQNPNIKQHCLSVKKFASALGKEIGLDEEALSELEFAGYYHDIGQVGLGGSLINKKCGLDQTDWANVMKHPEVGYQILKSIPDFGRLAEFVLYHHERVDGVGYPFSSMGKEIPLQAKILGLAEAYSDMIVDRPYRKKLTKDEAILELKNGAGTQFDKNLVDIFVNKILPKEKEL